MSFITQASLANWLPLAGSEHDCNVLGSAIPRAPSATDVKPGNPDASATGSKDGGLVRGTLNASSFSGSSQTSVLTSGLVCEGQAGNSVALPMSRTDSLVRGPTTTGSRQTSVRNARTTRNQVPTTVSAFVNSAQVCATGRGWPYLRLRELRFRASLSRDSVHACAHHRAPLAERTPVPSGRGRVFGRSRSFACEHDCSADCFGTGARVRSQSRPTAHLRVGHTAKAFGLTAERRIACDTPSRLREQSAPASHLRESAR